MTQRGLGLRRNRILTTVMAIAASLVVQPVGRAAAGGCYTLVLQQDEVLCYDRAGHLVSQTPVTPPSPGSPPPDPATLIEIPFLTPGMPDGSLCIETAVVSVPDGPNSSLAAAAEQAWLRLRRTYQLCPGTSSVGPSVTEYVDTFVRTIPLPVPRPQIAPGWAITGKPAYLETHSTLAPAPVRQPTQFGPLEVTITGQYFVHWGDEPNPASFDGPYSTEGEPWPAGTITHTWDRSASVQVVVEARWTASWQLGPEQGVLQGLTTRATLANFAVAQLQAVIG